MQKPFVEVAGFLLFLCVHSEVSGVPHTWPDDAKKQVQLAALGYDRLLSHSCEELHPTG